MKKIIVIAIYEAYMPEDMMVDQLRESIDMVVKDSFPDFRATAENYHNEEEAEPWFQIEDVMIGTESMISVGGN